MRKILLMMFISVSTLTACSSDENKTQSGDNSFKKQIIKVDVVDPSFIIDNTEVIGASNIEYFQPTKDLLIYFNNSAELNIKVQSFENGVFSGLYYVGDIPTVPCTVRISNGKYIFNTIINSSGSSEKMGDVFIITVK
ncbi:hypothetical protein [Flavobacterium sp. 3-210]